MWASVRILKSDTASELHAAIHNISVFSMTPGQFCGLTTGVLIVFFTRI